MTSITPDEIMLRCKTNDEIVQFMEDWVFPNDFERYKVTVALKNKCESLALNVDYCKDEAISTATLIAAGVDEDIWNCGRSSEYLNEFMQYDVADADIKKVLASHQLESIF